ncbi:MAG: division/cell wall cluster transcriptional repressor MraZ [Thermomicrobiales bacterium]
MFLGRYAHTLDAKGRLAVPARFREALTGGVVATRGIDRCLALYPMDAWTPLAERINALPITDLDARTFRRMVFAEAAHLELDAQGRILLPPDLRRYAELDREAFVVGVNTSIEIWSPRRWETVTVRMDDDGAAIAQRLANLI